MQFKKNIRKAKKTPRYIKHKGKNVIRPVAYKVRLTTTKLGNIKQLATDKNQRYYFLQKRKAARLFKQARWDELIHLWQEQISNFGEDTPAYFFVELSRAYQGKKDYRTALEVLKDAVVHYPKNKIQSSNQDLRDWLTISREKAELSFARRIDNIDDYKQQISRYHREKARRRKNQLKVAIFSAVSGGYDLPKPPEVLDPRFDYIFFTDTPSKMIGIYDVRPLPFIDADPTRSARFVKTNPHKLISEYDIVVWVDSNLLITGDIHLLIDDVVRSGMPFGAMKHAVRKSPYEEMEICIKQGRDDPESIIEQRNFYKKDNYDSEELIESNVLVYDLRDGKLNDFLDEWWCQIDRFSKRDQISINYALDKHKIDWHRFTDYPITSRNHPAFALMDHAAETSESKLPRLLSSLGAKVSKPNTGEQYSKVKKSRLKQRNESITVVLPVHNAFDEVSSCLESIKKYKHNKLELIIIDDGSDQDTQNLLERFHGNNSSWTKLIRHKNAEGYTRSVNEGLKKSTADMTIILNSDTIVTSDWARKIADVMFCNEGVGIVGPLSSAASHQSVPDHKSSSNQTAINNLPEGTTVENMNNFAERWSYTGLFPRVPLVHGFCFAVRKEVVQKIGYLDSTSFPKGYGEENDYCLRATHAGFSLAIATNTYVFHHKSKSFKANERIKLMNDGMKSLVEKHGQRRVDRAVATMQINPILKDLRTRFATLYKS